MSTDLAALAALSRGAQPDWARTSLEQRKLGLSQVADELVSQKSKLAPFITADMGMPISAAGFNVQRAADYIQSFVDQIDERLAPVTTRNDDEVHVVHRVPRGVHAAIFPWNFPFSNMVWACVQSLLCGNTVLLKMSELVPQSSAAFDEIMQNHLPPSVFTMIYGAGDVGAELIEQDVDFISFTGSTKTGKYIYESAARRLIPVVLELGGSAPGIVCQHADNPAEHIAIARLNNSGQRCDGLKRLIVHESIYDQTLDQLAAEWSKFIVGDPRSADTTLGPLASRQQTQLATSQIQDALDKGSTMLVGAVPESDSNFVYPTILTNIDKSMRVWSEEVFAPVLPVVAYTTDDEAIALANDTEFGLGGHIYCFDRAHAHELANKIETGMVSINGSIYTRPYNPFGGIKQSGFGREHGRWGIDELTITKVIAEPANYST